MIEDSKRRYVLPPDRRRSMLVEGFLLLARHPGALVWTYLLNLGVALLFSLRLHAQLSSLLDNSMAAQRLSSAFDLGTVGAAFARLGYRQPPSGASIYAGVPLYVLLYFVIVPGALVSFRERSHARLGGLFLTGAAFFWRFVRITLLTVLVSGLILGPLFALQSAWSAHVDEHVVGVAAIYQQVPGILIILLVACVLRLYFDLVEVYTVQLDTFLRSNGKRDTRVRKTLLPALRGLWRNLPWALGSFVLLALLGLAVFFLTGRVAIHTLAQPRVWPAFLLIQLGLVFNLAMRFWQRAAETVLSTTDPLPLPPPYPEPALPPTFPVDHGIIRSPDPLVSIHDLKPGGPTTVVQEEPPTGFIAERPASE